MISFLQVVNRIKSECPSFNGGVGASVSFMAALQNSSDLALPQCFVMPKDFKDFSLIDYDPTFPETLKIKVTKETFQTVICIDNSANRGHKDGGPNPTIPLDLLNTIQSELETAFTGWKPTNLPDNAGEINIAGGEYVDGDNKQLWYVFEWSILYRRTSGGLTAAQQEEINNIVFEDQELGLLHREVIRNSRNTPGLQPVANPDFDKGFFPDGDALPADLEAADGEADLDTDETAEGLLDEAHIEVDGNFLLENKDPADPTPTLDDKGIYTE